MTLPDLVKAIQNDPGWIFADEAEPDEVCIDDFLCTEQFLTCRENVYFESTTDPADRFILVI